MNASIDTLAAQATNTKPLWAAVGVLGVAVLAMGASLVYVQVRPIDGHSALAGMAPAILPEPVAVPLARVTVPESLTAQEDLVEAPKPPVVVVRPPPPRAARPAPTIAAAGPVATAPVPAPVAVAVPAAPQVAVNTNPGAATNGTPSVVTGAGLIASQPVVKPICANCGTIESVTSVQRKGASSGVGTVAGGVLGAVLGNQVGKGSGRTIATILGAVGGGFAGNTIEKNVKKETVYQVRVQMEDGSTRTVEQAALPAVGAKVTVDGGVLLPAGGSYSGVTTPTPTAPPLPVPVPHDMIRS